MPLVTGYHLSLEIMKGTKVTKAPSGAGFVLIEELRYYELIVFMVMVTEEQITECLPSKESSRAASSPVSSIFSSI